MCGIFGLLVGSKSSFDRARLQDVVEGLFELSESRGKESSGLLTIMGDSIEMYKDAIRGSELIRKPVAKAAIHRAANTVGHREHPVLVMGHARMVTNGSSAVHENNQPVIVNGFACIHNGIIVNDEALWKAHPGLGRRFEVDTEVALAITAARRAEGRSLSAAIAETFREMKGANSIALVSTQDDALILASTNGSLFYAVGAERDEMLFASERFILERALEHRALRRLFSLDDVAQVTSGTGRFVPFAFPVPQQFPLFDGQAAPSDSHSQRKREIVDLQPGVNGGGAAQVHASSLAEVERGLSIDFGAIRALRRCSRCLLPETFPFVRYDAHGVCNYCNNHVPLQKKSEMALRTELEPLRRKDGRPDCLVPLSGGRDSCYGIHYVKNVLGMNPVAYTYDWGMVTDLARRNISRMCGALGVEHVLISADIRRKREYVRMNVEAWLKKPHLGTIPLFMAGDKQFFYYADMLRRQMDLGKVIFSMNPLERTDFKVGFCDIDENYGKEKHYNLSIVNKLRLALFYAKHFITNPAYLNASVPDTLGAYISYYFMPKNYLTVFDYIDWDERLITETLLRDYGWETAPDTRSTWRIGDGTAAFYNYIYLRVAGFTENDTFRSNQIREGLITRHQALAKLEEDNRPRVESFKWYCDTVGLEAERTIDAINRIPTMY
jgi:glutamine---fructose-6-phosphate transaminase (isomerizing)